MSVNQVNLPWGLSEQSGKLIHVSSVPNGLMCGCVCPSCEGKLVAKNRGVQKSPHFAHYIPNTSCEGWLHWTAKITLRERIERSLLDGSKVPVRWRCKKCACDETHTGNLIKTVDGVLLERGVKGVGIRPDLRLTNDGVDKVYIEVVDTHDPEPKTRQYAHNNGMFLAVLKLTGPQSIEQIRTGILDAEEFTFCPCKPCQHCASTYSCSGNRHTFCEQCQECFIGRHTHCIDCQELTSGFRRCRCCLYARKFKRTRCDTLIWKEHGHCRSCHTVVNARKLPGLFYETCDTCAQTVNRKRVEMVKEQQRIEQQRREQQQLEKREKRERYEQVAHEWEEFSKRFYGDAGKEHPT